MKEYLKIIGRVALGIAILAILVGVTTVFIPQYRQMVGLDNRCHHLQALVDIKQREIHIIKTYQARLMTDPEFVARIAHENRRVFPNELVFVFDQK